MSHTITCNLVFMMNIFYFCSLKKFKGRWKREKEGRKTLTWGLDSLSLPPLGHCGVQKMSLLFQWLNLVSESLHLMRNETSKNKKIKKQEAHYLLAMPQSPSSVDQISLSALSFMGLVDWAHPLFVAGSTSWGCSPKHEISRSKVLRYITHLQ